jgi:hypothetical protein|tara:strand:+ start:276 stop:533 length:258 start_codon:yes stop_codon:yes gene_type:complete
MKRKQQLNEQELLSEFLGSLVKAVFNTKAKAVGKAAFADPLLHTAFQNYIDDTKKFKAKLKKAGITSTQDLKKSFADKGLEDLIH